MRTKFLVACLLPLLLVACSKPDGGEDVASVDSPARPSATPSLSRLDLLSRFSQCMREHGVPMTDPVLEGGTVRHGTYDKNAVSEDTEMKAEEACKQYRPPQETGPQVDLKNELARQFSRCMREHGVENFPDPNADGPTRIGSEIGDDPQYPAARAFCDAQAATAFASMQPSAGAKR